MKSIFQHKQYNLIPRFGGHKGETRICKTINGLDWEITPLETDRGEKYHNREINLAFLENDICLDNYMYSINYIDESDYRYHFIYLRGSLNYFKKYNKMDADYIKDKEIPFSFREACEYIKNEMK